MAYAGFWAGPVQLGVVFRNQNRTGKRLWVCMWAPTLQAHQVAQYCKLAQSIRTVWNKLQRFLAGSEEDINRYNREILKARRILGIFCGHRVEGMTRPEELISLWLLES